MEQKLAQPPNHPIRAELHHSGQTTHRRSPRSSVLPRPVLAASLSACAGPMARGAQVQL